MLISKVYSPILLFWARLISSILLPYYSILNLFRTSYTLDTLDVKIILVTEYHRIGDVIMIAPALQSIKARFPDAHLVLLCNEPTAPLANHLNLADEVIPVTVPWTHWDWSLSKWIEIRSFARKLGIRGIDLAFDFKGDLRNSWFVWNVGAKISMGYSATGGSFFFTHPQTMDQGIHQSRRANELITKAGCSPTFTEPELVFNKNGVIVLHVGATDPRRAWPEKYWLDLIRLLSAEHKISVIKTPESKQLIKQIKDADLKTDFFAGNLVEFKDWLKDQKCLIAPDSMAGHLAAYVGIPVISIFGAQNPDLTCPVNKGGVVITPDIPCDHKRDHWRLCAQCMGSIHPRIVSSALLDLLSQLEIHK